jgi:hypothetical protein
MKSPSITETQPFPILPRQAGRPSKAFPWGRLTVVLVILVCLPILLMLSFAEGMRTLLALSVASVLFFLLKRSPGVGVASALVYLSLVGGLRRWLIPVFDWSGTDTLLIVAPTAAVLYLLMTRRSYTYTPLMRLLLGLLVLMILEVVNPLQGGLAVGVAGILFFIAPLLWYFIGRQVGSAAVMTKVMQAIIVVSVCAALYGLYQTYFGFNYGEQRWIATTFSHYVAMNVGGVIRAFSFFTSVAEYAQFLGLGIVVLWAMFLRGNRLALLPIPLLLVAIFFASVRFAIVFTAISCTILWAIQGRSYRSWVPRGLVALVVVVAALYFGLNKIHETHFSQGTQAIADHTTLGLLNSADKDYSTAGFHMGEIINGVVAGFTNPLGRGLGSTTIASDKFGGDTESAEFDIGNMFLSLGFIGGLIFLIVIAMSLSAGLRYWQQSRTLVGLVIVGILVQLIGNWFNGGFYAASTLAWLCVGALERLRLHHAHKAKTLRENPVSSARVMIAASVPN